MSDEAQEFLAKTMRDVDAASERLRKALFPAAQAIEKAGRRLQEAAMPHRRWERRR